MSLARCWKQQVLLVGGDIAILLLTFDVAMELWWARVGPYVEFFPTAFFGVGAYLLAITMFDLYNIQPISRHRANSTLAHLIGAVFTANVALSLLFYMLPTVKLPRSAFVIQMGLAVPLLFIWRIWFLRLRQKLILPKPVLIIGSGEAGLTALELLNAFGSEYQVVGFVEDDSEKRIGSTGGHRVVGVFEDLPSLVKELDVRVLVMTTPADDRHALMQTVLKCRMRGVIVYDLVALGEHAEGKILLDRVRDAWFVYAPGFLILHNRMFQRFKRVMDVVCAAIGLAIASPILLISAVLILLESGRPVLFRQNRVGQNELIFVALKLRTMTGTSQSPSLYTERNDARVTMVGRLLRFFRIDEIPQMWNVLKGEMSFIGPRAECDVLVNEYKQQIPYYSLRHTIKPGITGWAQIYYPYGSSVKDAYSKLEYDLCYVKNISFALDLKILLKTISVVMLGKGSR